MNDIPENYYKQSAILPFKKIEDKYHILLVTSRNKSKWIVPKGIVEENLTPRKSAEKEALEEAGIAGKTAKKSIGKYTYEKWGGTCEVEVFPCKVKLEMDEWDEMHFRERKWFAIEKSLKKIANKQLKSLIKKYFTKRSKL